MTTVVLSSAPRRARAATRAGPCCSTSCSLSDDAQQLLHDFDRAKASAVALAYRAHTHVCRSDWVKASLSSARRPRSPEQAAGRRPGIQRGAAAAGPVVRGAGGGAQCAAAGGRLGQRARGQLPGALPCVPRRAWQGQRCLARWDSAVCSHSPQGWAGSNGSLALFTLHCWWMYADTGTRVH